MCFLCEGQGGRVQQKLSAQTTEGDPGGQKVHLTAAGEAQQGGHSGAVGTLAFVFDVQ